MIQSFFIRDFSLLSVDNDCFMLLWRQTNTVLAPQSYPRFRHGRHVGERAGVFVRRRCQRPKLACRDLADGHAAAPPSSDMNSRRFN
jgi:hypothetical protein